MTHFFCLLQLHLVIFFITISAKTFPKATILTPTDNNKNGVHIDINGRDVTPTATGWNINVSTNTGWHLHISMNDSWTFLSHKVSTIILKTYSDSTTKPHDKDIIFAFSQNANKYISSTNIGIYPQCNPANGKQSMAAGNIDVLLKENQTQSRANKLTHGLKYDNISSNIETSNEFPLTIQLINNPIKKWSKWQYSNQQCQFEAFSSHRPLDIYISAANIAEILNINKVEIALRFNETVSSDAFELSAMSWIQSHSRTIIFVLIGITLFLFSICNVLIAMIIKQTMQNAQNANVAVGQLPGNGLGVMEYEGSVRSETFECQTCDI